jgi:hypothetical protein
MHSWIKLWPHFTPLTDKNDIDPGSVRDILHEFLSGASLRTGAPFEDPIATLARSTRRAHIAFFRAALSLRPRPVAARAGTIWAYATTGNQTESLAPVLSELGTEADALSLPDPLPGWGRALAWRTLRCLSQAKTALTRLPHSELAKVADMIDVYALALAEAQLFTEAARRNPPAAVLIANDHSPRNRAILAAAQAAGLPTAYLQHAAVGGIECPLNMDLAFLHGQHSLDIYSAIGPVTAEVCLVGSPKIDVARRDALSRTKTSPFSIGVFPGLFDHPNRVGDVVAELREGFPKATFALRRHPRDARAGWDNLMAEQDLSNALNALHIMEALQACDLVIFDDSNVGLEAAALCVPVLRTTLKEMPSDQYALSGTKLFTQCEAALGALVPTAQAALDGRAQPDAIVLDQVFSDWSKGEAQADKLIAERLRAFLV